MPVSSRKLLLKLSLVAAMVIFVLSLQPAPAVAYCSYGGFYGYYCDPGCYDWVYCEAIACFQESWRNGGNGEECCHWNNMARFCGSDCQLFCAEP